jgi:hypothetical protein
MTRRSPRSNALFLFGCIFIIISIISGNQTYQSDSTAVEHVDTSCNGMDMTQYSGLLDFVCKANGKEYSPEEWARYKVQEAQDRQNNALWNALKSFGLWFGIGLLSIILGFINLYLSPRRI